MEPESQQPAGPPVGGEEEGRRPVDAPRPVARDDLDVSVVIPVHNGGPWFEVQLRAVAAQRYEGSWELLVADNGSTDGSASLARSWPDAGGRIRLVDASARRGPGAARNIGAAAARGALLAFCDADDVVRPGWIHALASAVASGADVVAGTYDFGALNGSAPSSPRPAATAQLGHLPAGLAANLAVRRSAFDAVGGFCEDLQVGEDIDLCWRLQEHGYRFTVADAAVVEKRDRVELGPTFRQGLAYGRSGAVLHRRHRAAGARPDLLGALRSWAWLVVALPRLHRAAVRQMWVRALGVRIGRIVGSVQNRVFFP